MKFDVSFERVFPSDLQAVWRALTDREALGKWLMETDFVPEQGKAFSMWCENPDGGTDMYVCKCLSLEPERRMLWSWILDGRQERGETLVEFVLETVKDGTKLTIRHRGDRDPSTIEAFKGGWPYKLDLLTELLC